MAEKLDLKKFYEDTKLSPEHIHLLNIRTQSLTLKDKNYKITTANTAFGMLAHLNITSNSETPYIESRLFQSGIDSYKDRSWFFRSLSKLNIYDYDNYTLNPTAITMIQRYRSAFDKYEAQLGIQNPFTKKSGKEPGDN